MILKKPNQTDKVRGGVIWKEMEISGIYFCVQSNINVLCESLLRTQKYSGWAKAK